MTVDARVVGLAQALVVQVADDLAHAVLARLEVARMPHQVAERSHVAQIALAREVGQHLRVIRLTTDAAAAVVGHTRAVLARVEVNARATIGRGGIAGRQGLERLGRDRALARQRRHQRRLRGRCDRGHARHLLSTPRRQLGERRVRHEHAVSAVSVVFAIA